LTILYIALAGAAGTLARFGTERVVQGRAAIYMGATIIGCLTAVFAGMALAERLV